MRRVVLGILGLGGLAITAGAVALFLSPDPEMSVCQGIRLKHLAPVSNTDPGVTLDISYNEGQYKYDTPANGMKPEIYYKGDSYLKTPEDIQRYCERIDTLPSTLCMFEETEDGRFGYIRYVTSKSIDTDPVTTVVATAYVIQPDGSEVFIFPTSDKEHEGAECALSASIFNLSQEMRNASQPTPD